MAWNPTVPATSGPLASAPVRDNFAALDTSVMAPLTALATGQVLVDAGGVIGGVTAGSNGQVLTLSSGVPTWTAPGMTNPMTGVGDLIVGGASGAATRLNLGTTGQVLTVVGGTPTWASSPGYPLLAPDGTAAAPSYSFTNATNYGITLGGGAAQLIASAGRIASWIGSGFFVDKGSLGIRDLSGPSSGVQLYPDANFVLAIRTGTNPQTLRLYNTYTDASNYEYFQIAAAATQTTLRQVAAGSGTQRPLQIMSSDNLFNALIAHTTPGGGTYIATIGSGATATAFTSARVNIGAGSSTSATSGLSRGLLVYETFNPSASSTMVASPFYINPIINYQAGGAGSYEAIRIAVTETALPTGQSYMIRATAGAAGSTDMFNVTNAGVMAVRSVASTTTPASGLVQIYAKTDKKVYIKDDAGVETDITTATAPGYPLLAPDGTLAAPSYSFASNPGTGMFYPGVVGRISWSLNGGASAYLSLGRNNMLTIRDTFGIEWGSNPGLANGDLIITRDAANTLAQRNGTNAQQINLYGTYTDGSNYERLIMLATTAQITFRHQFAGTGAARNIVFQTATDITPAIIVAATANNGVTLGAGNVTTNMSSGRVIIGNNSQNSATSGSSFTASIRETFNPSASSNMLVIPLWVNPTINFQAGGAGAYEVLRLQATETALPTNPCYLIRGFAGAAGNVDIFSVTNAGVMTVRGVASATTPASGLVSIYAKTDKKVYALDDAGVETALGGGGGSVSYPLLAPDGSVGAPSYAFTNQATLGLYRAASGQIGVSGILKVPQGGDSSPQYSFIGQTGLGFSAQFTDVIMASCASVGVALWKSTAYVLNANLALAWQTSLTSGSPDLFLARDAANTLGQRNGTTAQQLNVYSTYTDASNYERIEIQGSATGPAIWQRAAGTGTVRAMVIGTSGAANLYFATTGSNRWLVFNSGHFYANSDNTVDIGATASNRPRSVYVGSRVVRGMSAQTYSASMTIDATLGDIRTIDVTNTTAFTVNAPTGGVTGQELLIRFKNSSGGTMGTATFDAIFKMAAFAAPASATSKWFRFVYDGTNWCEVHRTPVDIPN